MVVKLLARIKKKRRGNNKGTLFRGDDELFKQVLSHTRVYGEYGCGQSTSWVASNTNAQVLSVDTSKIWVDKVLLSGLASKEQLNIVHIDLGAVAEWGYPIDYRCSDRFYEYTDWIWMQNKKPNTVLIDGRFRVCCFLTSLKYAEEGTNLLFDDYKNRPHYHVVEKYIDRADECGHQSLFVVPSADKIDYQALERDILNFRYVMN